LEELGTLDLNPVDRGDRGVLQGILRVRLQSRGKAGGKKIGWRDAVDAIRCIWKYRRG